ncbi:hypothetical protein [Mycobacterium sp. OTB74]|jgi:hypothetical protein|uniref:hypothetical protein n=1 Tax=Mycobacterium sp. OTB74 TaxID=1853452 RepID=UPI00247681A0|nr:hypothetical protein [Mycobacterium sp. OTB74]MDH6247728.1 hypothetical protein [Mycobacterium sp. OTB74]
MTAHITAKYFKQPTAAELLSSVPGVDITWHAAIMEDFAAAMDQRGAFANLSRPDARRVARAIADDITGSGHPKERLARRARSDSNCAELANLDDTDAVRAALTIAAELSTSRAYGIRWG